VSQPGGGEGVARGSVKARESGGSSKGECHSHGEGGSNKEAAEPEVRRVADFSAQR
jgi:hypothetical protein